MLMGLIPAFGDFLSTMPVTIGNAVLFVAYLQLFGTAYNSLNGTMFTSYTIFRLAGPVLFGVSLNEYSASVVYQSTSSSSAFSHKWTDYGSLDVDCFGKIAELG